MNDSGGRLVHSCELDDTSTSTGKFLQNGSYSEFHRQYFASFDNETKVNWNQRSIGSNCNFWAQNPLVDYEVLPRYTTNSVWASTHADFGTQHTRQQVHNIRQHSIATSEYLLDFQKPFSERCVAQQYLEQAPPTKQILLGMSAAATQHSGQSPRNTHKPATQAPPTHQSGRRTKKDELPLTPSTIQQQQNEMDSSADQKKKEIYVYNSPFNLYGMAWSTRPEPENKFRLAVGSFIEEYNNKVSIVQLREEQGEFRHLGTFDHPYPATKVVWIPDKKGQLPDLIATTGDYLRIWSVGGPHGATFETMLDNNRSSQYCAPLTSADWNEVDPSLIATSSIDTTCTIWEVETGTAVAERKAMKGSVKTQLIAHDREVFDIAFSKINSGKDVFGSVGADGSVRMFDIRHMEYSMIVFEEPNRQPLLRLAFNQHDHNYLATFAQNSSEVFIIDIRIPSIPVATLKNHSGPVNAISWAPHSSCHICTVAEDRQALIWDVHTMPRPVEDPILAYSAAGEINQVQWSSSMTDWISISYGKSLELLRV